MGREMTKRITVKSVKDLAFQLHFESIEECMMAHKCVQGNSVYVEHRAKAAMLKDISHRLRILAGEIKE
jgi:hypothetical protein